jgi:hypothetical protein
VQPQRTIHIADYDPAWPARFRALGAELRAALGDVAVRIDHIGSTSVPGLAAKPVIDVQVTVERLEPAGPFRVPLERLGLVYRSDNTERTERYFREAPGERRTHIHVRRRGSFSEQFPLLPRLPSPASAERRRVRAGQAPLRRPVPARRAGVHRREGRDHLGADPPGRRVGAADRLGAGSERRLKRAGRPRYASRTIS